MDIQSVMAVDDVLAIVRENRARHTTMVAEATAAYTADIVAKLRKTADELEKNGATRVHISTLPPTDNTKVYDRAIAMLEKTADKTITLSFDEFGMLIEDEWEWTDHWLRGVRGLSKTAANYCRAKGVN
jgi:hypothetical protein